MPVETAFSKDRVISSGFWHAHRSGRERVCVARWVHPGVPERHHGTHPSGHRPCA